MWGEQSPVRSRETTQGLSALGDTDTGMGGSWGRQAVREDFLEEGVQVVSEGVS